MTQIAKKFANRTLTDDEANKIAEFVLSIGIVGEKYGVEQVLGTKDGETVYCKIEPGMKVDTISVRRQYAAAPDASITVKLVGADGKEIATKTEAISGLGYNTAKTITLGFDVPADLAKGSYIEAVITDASGNAIASVYKLTYNG